MTSGHSLHIGRIEAIIIVGESPGGLDRQLAAMVSQGIPVAHVRRHGGRGLLRALEVLWRRHSLRPHEVLIVDGCVGSCRPPAGALRLDPGVAEAALAARSRSSAGTGLPAVPDDPDWTLQLDGADPDQERVRDSWLTIADGLVGTVGSPLTWFAPARREVVAGNAYVGVGPATDLLRVPDWTLLDGQLRTDRPIRRVLDLRTGLLHHAATSSAGRFRAVSLASRVMPGVGIIRAVGAGARTLRSGPAASSHGSGPTSGDTASKTPDATTGRLVGTPGGVAFAVANVVVGSGPGRHLERIAAIHVDPSRPPATTKAVDLLGRARSRGIDGIIADQRVAWARRWREMDIRLEGDARLQHAIRFSLFHLDASIGRQREAPLGPRGLTGPAYRGHVFWDSDIFVLPFFAATRPAAARAMLNYRVRRLGAAQEAAREAGLRGAWFPWESAADGRDVTPRWVVGPDGRRIDVWTGLRELHVIADIAWAGVWYAAWSGDRAFLDGDGRHLLIETARFWASRLERDPDGTVHLRGIIGPDEYHELVDDNAYTNVMARWNLRAAADAVERAGFTFGLPGRAEVADWRDVAGRIVDGLDPSTCLYEQFAGFHALEPVRIADLTARPVWGDVFLGRERTERAQVVKQSDVLMLHHLVPDEVAPGSLGVNLDYYEPRTAHGSSLSPGTHAALLARAGRFEAALDALEMTAYLDLDDRTRTAEQGLHIPTMGGLWQALVMGFAGIRPAGDALAVDPRLPPAWSLLEVPVRFRGRRFRVTLEHDRITLRSSGPVAVAVAGEGRLTVSRSPVALVRRGDSWVRRD